MVNPNVIASFTLVLAMAAPAQERVHQTFVQPRPALGAFGVDSVAAEDWLFIANASELTGIPVRGAVHVYERVDGAYAYRQRITHPSPAGLLSPSNMGRELEFHDGVLLVSAGEIASPIRSRGVIFAYEFVNDEWKLTSTIQSPNPVDTGGFGSGITMAGDRLVARVLTPPTGSDPDVRGEAYIFRRVGSDWIVESQLMPRDPEPGSYMGQFGYFADGAQNACSVRYYARWESEDRVSVYDRDAAGNWTLSLDVGEISTQTFVRLQSSALDEDRLVVGTVGFAGSSRGQVDIYERDPSGSGWLAPVTIHSPYHVGADFGREVAVEGDWIYVTATLRNPSPGCPFCQGVVAAYHRDSNGDWGFEYEIDARVGNKVLPTDRGSNPFGGRLELNASGILLAGDPESITVDGNKGYLSAIAVSVGDVACEPLAPTTAGVPAGLRVMGSPWPGNSAARPVAEVAGMAPGDIGYVVTSLGAAAMPAGTASGSLLCVDPTTAVRSGLFVADGAGEASVRMRIGEAGDPVVANSLVFQAVLWSGGLTNASNAVHAVR